MTGLSAFVSRADWKGIGMKLKTVVTVCLISSLVWGAAGGCSRGATSKLKVVTSTSLMEYIVEQVGGDRVEVMNLVPPNQHPGNFDIKPGDIQNLATANLLLLHGLPGETFADKLIESANNSNLTVVRTSVNGNWMIPSIQLAATDKVASVLSEVDARNKDTYQKSADAYKKRIESKETGVKARLAGAGVSSVKVIASVRQADFLQWAGFSVVATFVGPQALTPETVKDLIDKGTAEGVTLVVNNLQDGQDAGKAIAGELEATNLNLSNFPGGLPDTETWEKAFGRNVDILLNAIAK